MAFISVTKEQCIDDVIYNSLCNVAALKTDDMEEKSDFTDFYVAFLLKRNEFIFEMVQNLPKYNAVIDIKGTLSWSFPVPADETAFNLLYDVWKVVSINIYGKNGSRLSNFTMQTKADPPAAQDVTNLTGIVVITNNP